MKLLQIQKKNQLTLPADIRKTLQLKEHDLLAVEVEGNRIILTPQKVINRDEEWFFSKRWQEGEKEADRDFKDGNCKDFKNVEDLIKDLNS
ncbi:MAG: AbrB/MazE/SpoVT family DNA-binding domain-containing protein [Candidatus Eremiobacterota bacterium]